MSAPDALITVHDALSAAGCDPHWYGERLKSRCPGHEDRNPSLSVGRGTKQPVVFHCHAGCEPRDVAKALELDWAALCEPRRNGHGRLGEPVAEYHYTDETGRALFRVVRYRDKQFRQHAADGTGGWGPKLGDARRVLYRLPEVLAAVDAGEPVFIIEGEKDADRLRAEGVTATCNPMGAGSWRVEYAEGLAGADVMIVADRDVEGYRHARHVARALTAAGATVTVLEPAVGKDVSDHLAAGHAVDDLTVLDLTVEFEPAAPAPSANGHHDLVLVASSIVATRVEWLWPGRLPVGKLVMLDGDPDQGKSTIALDLAARLSAGRPMPDGHELDGAAPSLVLSAEDGLNDTIVPRLQAAGADLSQVHIWTDVADTDADGQPRHRPPVIPGDLGRLARHVRQLGARLIIVDVLMAYLDGAVNSHHDQDIRRVLHALSVIAETTRATILILRHLNKSGGGKALYRGGGSIGIIGAARSGLLAAQHPEDPERKVLAVHKHNLAEPAPALMYEIVSSHLHHCGAIRWLGTTSFGADALMEGARDDGGEDGGKARNQAIEFLQDLLTGNPMSVQDVKKEALAAGLSWRTVRRAQSQLGIKPEHRGNPSGDEQWWEWGLPGPKVATDPQDGQPPGVGHLGKVGHLGAEDDHTGRLDI